MDAGACVPIAAKPSQRDNRMSSAQRWKRAERKIAALLGGAQIPNNGYGQPDVIAGHLAVQVKTRTALPAWFLDAVDQSIRDAGPDQWPVVIVAHRQPAHGAAIIPRGVQNLPVPVQIGPSRGRSDAQTRHSALQRAQDVSQTGQNCTIRRPCSSRQRRACFPGRAGKPPRLVHHEPATGVYGCLMISVNRRPARGQGNILGSEVR